jgi:hypothetical protein
MITWVFLYLRTGFLEGVNAQKNFCWLNIFGSDEVIHFREHDVICLSDIALTSGFEECEAWNCLILFDFIQTLIEA